MNNTTDLQNYRDELKQTVDRMKTMAETVETECRSMNADEFSEYDELEAKRVELTNKVATLERTSAAKELATSKRSHEFGAPVIKVSRKATRTDLDNSFKAWLYNNTEAQRDTYRRSADLLDINYQSSEYEFRAQSSDVATQGIELVDSVTKGIIAARDSYGGLESLASKDYSQVGADAVFVVTDDTDKYGVWSPQNTAVANQSIVFNKKTIGFDTVKTAVFPVSIELTEDAPGVLEFIGKMIGERLARTVARDLVAGNGGKLRGIMQDLTAGAGTTLNGASLTAMHFGVKDYYRRGGNVAWLMNDTTLAYLATTLVDGDGRPLWGTGLNADVGTALLGKKIVVENELDDGVVLFGDFSAFMVRYMGGVRVIKDHSRYVDQLAIGCFGYLRAGSALIWSGAKPIVRMDFDITP